MEDKKKILIIGIMSELAHKFPDIELVSKESGSQKDFIEYVPLKNDMVEMNFYEPLTPPKTGKQKRRERRKQERNKKK